MKEIELKAQLKIIERLILLIGFAQGNATIPDPLEYLYNRLIEWEKTIKNSLLTKTNEN